MTGETFVSFAQNREDVVLWRALGGVRNGRYVEVGANDPRQDSISKAFYDRGWSGLEIEPDPDLAQSYRVARPRDAVVEAAVTGQGDQVVLHRAAGTGLSTISPDVGAALAESGRAIEDVTVQGVRLDTLLADTGFDHGEIHFAVIDVEGAEADVLETVDLRAWRPWVLVIEATEPNSTRSTRESWEESVLAAGYRFCLFDGLSCYYVAEEHAPTLATSLSYGATATDDFVDARVVQLQTQLQEAMAQLAAAADEVAEEETRTQKWRTRALITWATGVAQAPELEAHQNQIELLNLALDKARKKITRQEAQIKTMRRRLRASGPDGPDGPDDESRPTLRAKAARSLTRRGR